MATTAGALSLVSKGSTVASVLSAVATGGTAPYTYQWYKSTTTGFTPGAGNLIAGATALALSDSGLIPSTTYYYKVIATDSGSVAGTSSQLAVLTNVPDISQNAFLQAPFLGMIDMRFDGDTVSVEIDSSQATPLLAGAAVKVVNSLDGVPKVVGVAANSDDVFGFINFDIKSGNFQAGDRCEISQAGNVIYLYATAAIARGARCQLDILSPGGVTALVASSGADIVGYAYDQGVTGQLLRVRLRCPSFTKA